MLVMSRIVHLFRLRVPLYVSLPVIVFFGAAGYVASTMRRPPAPTTLGHFSTFVDGVNLPMNAVTLQAQKPLNPEAALAAVNAFRTKNGRGAVVLDARLTKAAAMQSETQAKRSEIGHDGPGGSRAKDRAARAGYRAKIASENVASGQNSFSDVMRSWEGSADYRENLMRPEVTAIGVAMSKDSSGRPYWTLVLGAELKSRLR